MTLIKWVLRHRAGRTVLAALAAFLAWEAWLGYAARGKVAPDLAQHADARGAVDLSVTLNFRPERFHVLTFQRFGRVSGTEDDRVEVRGVPLPRVREMARFYWVRRIDPLRAGR